ncbi:MAG: SAM-dependent methyltransferase, partial [Prochlorococcaceae cyanobacterium ETNP1_MAG_8]|nr:SAM-dependent methyltransferase [Prochlorococcaceae cyanobacterium ETNP1_MAG_8]
AEQQGWSFLGESRQGQALLALGLAERLHALQSLPTSQLSAALNRREALLRLVDPAGLGEFRWLAFELRPKPSVEAKVGELRCRFLEEPVS